MERAVRNLLISFVAAVAGYTLYLAFRHYGLHQDFLGWILQLAAAIITLIGTAGIICSLVDLIRS